MLDIPKKVLYRNMASEYSRYQCVTNLLFVVYVTYNLNA